jgi:transposase-like protein
MSVLNAPHFHDEEAAFAKLESIVWPNGPVCPHCGATDRIYPLKGVRSKASKKNPEGIIRHGLKKCGHCRKQFTARVGTVFESSHIPLHLWFQAAHLLCSSKKGISSHQLHRILKVTYQAAWFASHRLREAMRSGPLAPMGGTGSSGVAEVDSTYIGRKKGMPKRRGTAHKHAVLSLVERRGQVRSVHVENEKAATVVPIVNDNIDREARVMTDDALQFEDKLDDYAEHGVVNHSAKEYVRYRKRLPAIHTNTVEGYFSIFKRGMKGIYQHCSEKHLHRYLAEFDFRYNARSALGVEDEARTEKALRRIKGKRLTYRVTGGPRPEAGNEDAPPF